MASFATMPGHCPICHEEFWLPVTDQHEDGTNLVVTVDLRQLIDHAADVHPTQGGE